MRARQRGLVCLDVSDLPHEDAFPGRPKAHLHGQAEEHGGGGLACLDGAEESFPGRPTTHLGAGWDRGVEAPGYNGIASSRQARGAPAVARGPRPPRRAAPVPGPAAAPRGSPAAPTARVPLAPPQARPPPVGRPPPSPERGRGKERERGRERERERKKRLMFKGCLLK